MRNLSILLVFVLQIALHNTYGASTQNKTLKLFKLNPECKELKCPPISKPICVRLKYSTIMKPKNPVYVVMVNKCELKYMNCYEGVDAIQMPMAQCQRGVKKTTNQRRKKLKTKHIRDIEIATNLKNTTGKPRLKRNADEGQLESRKQILRSKDEPHTVGYKTAVPKLQRSRRDTSSPKPVLQASNMSKSRELHQLNKAKHAILSNEPIASKSKAKSKLRKLRSKKKNKKSKMRSHFLPSDYFVRDVTPDKLSIIDNDWTYGDDDDDDVRLDLPAGASTESTGGDGVISSNKGRHDDASMSANSQEYGSVQVDISELPDTQENDYVLTAEDVTDKVNEEQYQAECPTTCPAKSVMMCARCKNGHYRTFLSACHMRMFHCKNPDEKLALVARRPCVMSAPFLVDLQTPEGFVEDPGDSDVVLNYLKCKQYGFEKIRPWSRMNCTF